MFWKVKIRKSDIVFSNYIRTRDGWKCQRCFKQFEPPTRGLHNSHFWGRGKESTRFDPENCDAMCFNCHRYWESHKTEYEAWKLKQLGEARYKALMVRAHTPRKRDDKLALIYAQECLKSLEEGAQ